MPPHATPAENVVWPSWTSPRPAAVAAATPAWWPTTACTLPPRCTRGGRSWRCRSHAGCSRRERRAAAARAGDRDRQRVPAAAQGAQPLGLPLHPQQAVDRPRSEEHTSEPVTNAHLVCRLLLEKKKKQ